MFALGFWYLWLVRVGRFLGDRRTRYVLAWLAALAATAHVTHAAWVHWDKPDRLDGNDGHALIDFGSQWLMGRMLVLGEGHNLYERGRLRAVLQESYPRELEGTAKKDKLSDADQLMDHLMGTDEPDENGRRVGGALYPPINALLHYPVGLYDPQTGYRIHQLAQAVLALVSALAVSRLSSGRIWTPVALVLILYGADFYGNQLLAQNAIITLAIVLWGWALLARGGEVWCGVVWGLLAYKPVWAMSFFFVLLLTRRWRGCLAMLACGACLAALTLPFVGLHSWLEWRHVAAEVAHGNRIYENWIKLSRTLFSIPRRYLIDFEATKDNLEARATLETELVCWALYLLVVELSVRLIAVRGRDARATAGPGAAFLLGSAWLCCFQFMYYDALLAFPALIVLFLDPRRFFRPRVLHGVASRWQWLRLGPRRGLPTTPYRDGVSAATGAAAVLSLPPRGLYGLVANPFVLLPIGMIYLLQNYLIQMGYASDFEPYTIYCVLVLWAWCGWLWTREAASARRAAETPAVDGERGAAPIPEPGTNGASTHIQRVAQ
jgi:hypothetical protein